jgi:hypothetical protein
MKNICFCRGSNLVRPVLQFVARHYTDWAIPAPIIIYNHKIPPQVNRAQLTSIHEQRQWLQSKYMKNNRKRSTAGNKLSHPKNCELDLMTISIFLLLKSEPMRWKWWLSLANKNKGQYQKMNLILASIYTHRLLTRIVSRFLAGDI